MKRLIVGLLLLFFPLISTAWGCDENKNTDDQINIEAECRGCRLEETPVILPTVVLTDQSAESRSGLEKDIYNEPN